MPESIKELITKNIYETLADVSALTGYTDEATVVRNSPRGNIRKDRQVIIFDEGDTPHEPEPLQKNDYDASYRLVCEVLSSDGTAEPTVIPDEEMSQFADAVTKALMVDYSRGGYAINTIIGTEVALPEGMSGRALSLTVHYRTAKDNPFSQ